MIDTAYPAVSATRRPDAAQDVAPVVAQRVLDRGRRDGSALLDLLEDRRLRDLGADDEADGDQEQAREERYPPGPRASEVDAVEEDEVGEQQTHGEPGLDDAGVAALGPPRGVLVRHEDGSAPLGAEGQPLDDPDDDEKDRRENADRLVGRQQADGERGQAHDDERGDEDRLAADPVAEVTADDAADGTSREPDAESGEGRQGARHRVRVREERGSEVEGRGRAEPDEVVRLDHGAHRGADRHLACVGGASHRAAHLLSLVAHLATPSTGPEHPLRRGVMTRMTEDRSLSTVNADC